MLAVGDRAPDFSADTDGGRVQLSELAGKRVVLYFYPKDDTPGCTRQACEFTAGIAEFEKLDAVILGCSPDDEASHRKSIAKYDLKVQLLSDPTHATMEAYGAWGEKVLYGRKSVGVIRSTALIDPKGNVAHHWKKVRAAGHADHVAARLAALRG